MKRYQTEKPITVTDDVTSITLLNIDVPVLQMLATIHNRRKARRLHKLCKKMGIETISKPHYKITK